MITYEFTSGKIQAIFPCIKEDYREPGSEKLECPISLFFPLVTDPGVRDKLEEHIKSAIKEMVEKLDREFPTDGETK